jgi:hypothetical protein
MHSANKLVGGIKRTKYVIESRDPVSNVHNRFRKYFILSNGLAYREVEASTVQLARALAAAAEKENKISRVKQNLF